MDLLKWVDQFAVSLKHCLFDMARRSALSRSFRSDSQLSQFFLDGVTATGKVLGVGSYGSVVEVCYSKEHF